MSTEEPVAGLEAAIARTNAELAQLRAATYQGQDPGRVVTAVVDGEGMVVQVTFVPTVGRYDPAAVGEAVCAAVASAQQRLGRAIGELAERVAPADRNTAGPHVAGFSGVAAEGDDG